MISVLPYLIIFISAMAHGGLVKTVEDPFSSAFRTILEQIKNSGCGKFFEIPKQIRKFSSLGLNYQMNMIGHDYIPIENHTFIFYTVGKTFYNAIPIILPAEDVYPIYNSGCNKMSFGLIFYGVAFLQYFYVFY